MRSTRPDIRKLSFMLTASTIASFTVATSSLIAAAPTSNSDYSLSDAARGRVKSYLPRTYGKLVARDPVHVVALGDSITNLFTLDEHSEDWVQSYPALFLDRLATEFVYTGGVRLIKTKTVEHANKLLPLAGAEITYTNLAANGSTVLRGSLRAASRAFLNQPDLVLINFGINDSAGGVSIDRYQELMGQLIDLVKSKGADCIVFGPTLQMMGVSLVDEVGLFGLTRPYARVARELAEERDVLFVDLGDPSLFVGPVEDTATPEEFLPRVTGSLLQSAFRFDNGETDSLHINLSSHRLLGRAIHQSLIETPAPSSISTVGGTLTLAPDGSATAELTLANSSKQPLSCQVAPLRFAASHRPVSQAVTCEVPARGTISVSFSYATEGEKRATSFPPDTSLVRLPFLVGSQEKTTILTTPARVAPVGITWDTGITVNVRRLLEIKPTLDNPTNRVFESGYTATWNGQEIKGTVSLPPGETREITLGFSLPEQPETTRAGGLLVLSFENGPRFVRKLEVSKNLGLAAWQPLEPQSSYQLEGSNPPASDPSLPLVQFRVDADQDRIFFSYDLGSLVLIDAEDQSTAFVQIQIDGRAYGKRQKIGGIGDLRIAFPSAADGPGTVGSFEDGIFGLEYTNELERSGVAAELSTRSNGARRITVSIPRTYFYQHEYGRFPDKSLGNGNSQFGINTALTFLDPDPAAEIRYPNDRRFILINPLVSKNDAEALSALELTSPETGRWSARLF